MKHKKSYFGVKWFDGKYYDLIFINESKNGVIWGTLKDDKHITLLKENDAFSSHITIQDSSDHKHLTRLSKQSIPNEDEIAKSLFNPRPIREDEYDEKILYVTPKFLDAMNAISPITVEKIEKGTVHQYLDFPSMVEQIKNLILDIQKEPSAFFGACTIHDLVNNRGWSGVRTNKKVIFSLDDELWELSMPETDPLRFNDDNLNNLTELIGYSFISDGIKESIQRLSKN